jgi:hypothetical protein
MDERHHGEEWRPVEGWPYEVSDHGRVRRVAGGRGAVNGRILAVHREQNGYLRVHLYDAPRPHRRAWIHRLVCEAFNGPPPFSGARVRHLDGTRDNNSPDNLCWGTYAEDAADRMRHGTVPRGERHCCAVLTDADVAAIRAEYRLARGGRPCVPRGWPKLMGERFGVTPGTIQAITGGWAR